MHLSSTYLLLSPLSLILKALFNLAVAIALFQPFQCIVQHWCCIRHFPTFSMRSSTLLLQSSYVLPFQRENLVVESPFSYLFDALFNLVVAGALDEDLPVVSVLDTVDDLGLFAQGRRLTLKPTSILSLEIISFKAY